MVIVPSSDYYDIGFDTFQIIELGIEFHLDLQSVNVNLVPSFEQTC